MHWIFLPHVVSTPQRKKRGGRVITMEVLNINLSNSEITWEMGLWEHWLEEVLLIAN